VLLESRMGKRMTEKMADDAEASPPLGEVFAEAFKEADARITDLHYSANRPVRQPESTLKATSTRESFQFAKTVVILRLEFKALAGGQR
jgi:hypothetical protein